MAITQTGAMYKSLSFDNTPSRSYGVYITGEAVYNAPERAVEMISIPGRNGAFALDQGRFENIEVTYPAGIFAETEEEFAQAISDFRNYLCSKVGYCRLTDEYNPDEYRMAVYKSGLEVDPARLIAGEFNITFECKPQRWLTSGETKSSIASGGTLTNPTLFEASPLLETEGYGTIEFNGYEIEIENTTVGTIEVLPRATVTPSVQLDMSNANMNAGDTMTLSRLAFSFDAKVMGKTITAYSSIGYDSGHTNEGSLPTSYTAGFSDETVHVEVVYENLSFTFDPSASETIRTYFVLNLTAGGTTGTAPFSITIINYKDVKKLLLSISGNTGTAGYLQASSKLAQMEPLMGESTVNLSLGTIYIDCDLGDAYTLNGSDYVSLNQYIDLGSDLPKLPANGTATFTYDNTITSFKVTPRWWKI